MLRLTATFLLNLKGKASVFVGFVNELISDSFAKICSAKTTTDFTIALLFV